jgi:hypothetical protein
MPIRLMTKSPTSEVYLLCPASDEDGHDLIELEFVPNSKEPREIYVVFEGQRIAARDRLPSGEPDWLAFIGGVKVVDEANGQLAIFIDGDRVY